MTVRPPIPLKPFPIKINGPDFGQILSWPWSADDGYVPRMFQYDIPQQVFQNKSTLWGYRDAAGVLCGFGSIYVASEYGTFTQQRPYPYIPLLAVKPNERSRGHGQFIVEHLVGEAVILAQQGQGCCDIVFLDVYASNAKAIDLYKRCAFVQIGGTRFDSRENQHYLIMARRLSANSATQTNPEK